MERIKNRSDSCCLRSPFSASSVSTRSLTDGASHALDAFCRFLVSFLRVTLSSLTHSVPARWRFFFSPGTTSSTRSMAYRALSSRRRSTHSVAFSGASFAPLRMNL